MRFRHKKQPKIEGDLTPMIDMTFQLIAFFMVLLNFTEADQNEKIQLPKSELAKPPDAPFEHPIFVQLTRVGTVILGGQEVPLTGLKPYMIREGEFLKIRDKSPADATVIIRADASAPVGTVQEVIQICQESQFETFALRAEEDVN
ncbi:MAG: biopolymer transporter ExbD [Planctomycetales bacterium]|nr:biopolymer transporter ExbD [Planctomycetales bacterium]